MPTALTINVGKENILAIEEMWSNGFIDYEKTVERDDDASLNFPNDEGIDVFLTEDEGGCPGIVFANSERSKMITYEDREDTYLVKIKGKSYEITISE